MGLTTAEKLELQAGSLERAVPCPACGCKLLEVLLTQRDIADERAWLHRFYKSRIRGGDDDLKDRTEFTQSFETNIVSCVACGTVLRDPQPSPATLSQLYRSDHYGQDTLTQLAANQYEFYRRKAPALRARIPPAARILEVGSFAGSFLRVAREEGWNATGIDIGEETVAFMREAGHNVLRGDVRDLDLPVGRWDGVFVWNTFDQLPDPGAMLQRARELLARNGILVLRVPNGAFEAGCLQLRRVARDARRRKRLATAQAYNNFLTFPYLAGYTPNALGHLLADNGFQVVNVTGHTILRLADRDTLPCAAREEMRYKRAVLRLCRRVETRRGECYYPWIEVISRKL